MGKDLFDWLNSKKESEGTGLLVAPLSPEQNDNFQAPCEDSTPLQEDITAAEINDENEITQSKNEEAEAFCPPQNEDSDSILPAAITDSLPDSEESDSIPAVQESQEELSLCIPENEEANSELDVSENEEDFTAYTPENEEDESEIYVPENYRQVPDSSDDDITASLPQNRDPSVPSGHLPLRRGDENFTPHIKGERAAKRRGGYSSPCDPSVPSGHPPLTQGSDEPEEIPQDREWQERATGFIINLDEPPPELWTHINDDDPEPDYEPTESLQGAAYVQIHGRNFTERLHNTLKHRKERAEERAQSEHSFDTSHPYIQKAVILCATLLMALGFAWLSLWFIGRETPEGMKSRALSLKEAGKFEEAAEIYRRAHRRYPDVPEFLSGLSETSQKAGHVQTAKTAHDEYVKLTSPDTPPKTEQSAKKTETYASIKPENEAPKKPVRVSLILNDKPLTFNDYLDEANHAYNIGMYNRAVINFFRAMDLNSSDSRPYIGLAASYRMKGMYFDCQRILDEARRKFGRSPVLDMETYFLREAK